MRIAQVNAFHYPFMGGIEHRVHHISKRLAVRHDVIVLTGRLPGSPESEEMDGYRVVRLSSNYLNIYNPPYIKTSGLEKALERLGPDVADFHYRWSPSYNRAAKRHSERKVFTFHNTYGEGVGLTRVPSMINDSLWAKALKKFPRIVCVSDFVRRDLESRGFPPGRLVTVPNGIEMPPPMKTSDDGYLLFVGRLVGTKGIPYLLRAMRDVDSRLVVCGGGPDLRKLTRLAGSLGVGEKVTFLGRVDETEKLRLFAGCSVFVMPSVYESYGIAAAEAMSWGKPVVASDVGGLPEVVGGGGLLARPGDSKDLAEKLNALLGDGGLRKGLGARAKAIAGEYTWDRVACMMEQVYRDA